MRPMPKKLQRDAVRSVEDVADALAEARRVFPRRRAVPETSRKQHVETSDDGDISSALRCQPCCGRRAVAGQRRPTEARAAPARDATRILALGLAQGHGQSARWASCGDPTRQLAGRYASTSSMPHAQGRQGVARRH